MSGFQREGETRSNRAVFNCIPIWCFLVGLLAVRKPKDRFCQDPNKARQLMKKPSKVGFWTLLEADLSFLVKTMFYICQAPAKPGS